MIPQFRLSTVFGLITFLSLSLGGIGVAWDWLVPVQREHLVGFSVYFAPFWLPIVVVAHALAQRALHWNHVLSLAIGEAAAMAARELVFY